VLHSMAGCMVLVPGSDTRGKVAAHCHRLASPFTPHSGRVLLGTVESDSQT
jgi:hypothetical protein